MYLNAQYYEAYREESKQAKDLGAVVRWCGYYQCDHKYKLQRDAQRYFIIYVIKGAGFIIVPSGEKMRLSAGDITLYKPYEYQDITVDANDPMTYAGLIFSGAFFDLYMKESELSTLRKCSIGVNLELAMAFRDLVGEMIVQPEERDDHILAKTIEIISNINQAIRTAYQGKDVDSSNHRRMEKVADYIRTNYNQKITLEDAAKQAGLSKSWTQALFKRFYNMSPTEFQIRERIEHAKIMMANTSISICQMSNALGFSDQFYLSKVFKRYTGMSPKEYRNMLTLHDK